MPTVPDPLAEPLARRLKPAQVKALAEMDLHTVGDLLRHYPRRYQRWGELTPLEGLTPGEPVSVLVRVKKAQTLEMRSRRGTMLKLVVTDGSSELDVTFFNVRGGMWSRLREGRELLLSGTVDTFRGKRQLSHPAIIASAQDELDPEKVGSLDDLVPIYPASAKVTTDKIAAAVRVLLDTLGPVQDPLPEALRERLGLLGLREALVAVHRPGDEAHARRARHRLTFEEAFVLQVALARRRRADGSLVAVPRRAVPGGLLEAFDARLPFRLTAGQQDVGAQLGEELGAAHPMHRLLQGEVGSGKTVVALRAMLTVVDAGGQAALLAPTEVLAGQHHRSMTQMLGPLAMGGQLGGDERGTRVVLLTGSMPTAAKRAAMLAIASGDAGIVVGTHALLSDKVTFFDLGLVVVDEQHRFGVEQRDALRGKGRTAPHLLVMTATPIPRTVAMTVFGDLETSTLSELPAGRTPITTHVVPAGNQAWMDRTWRRVREEVDAGRQAYVVCPRIDGDDDDDPDKRRLVTVLETVELLRLLPELDGLRVEALHGRMAAEERDAVMAAFAAGAVDVLVATTVVEVGVDVPNASTMGVLDADRFGVSQLHQLRGRVGRGSVPGLCLLVTPLPGEHPSVSRLNAVAATTDGFELARVDLEARREGDVLGAAQSGSRSSLRLLRVLRDEEVIETARQEATLLVADDPDLAGHPALALAIEQMVREEQEAYLDRA